MSVAECHKHRYTVTMIRFFHVILWNLFRGPFMIPLMQFLADHPDKYSDEVRYCFARYAIRIMMRTGLIRTKSVGMENLPVDGGYVMYPNHEGKFDALGIMITHDKPCSVIIKDERSHGMLTRQFIDMIQGKRLVQGDFRQTIALFNEVVQEIRQGKRFIIFPEGGYYKGKRNEVGDFMPGSFKLAVKAKAPIVPVALIDSYKVFEESSWLWPVRPVIRYLEPILYDEYKDLKTPQIAELVKDRIRSAITEQEHAQPA